MNTNRLAVDGRPPFEKDAESADIREINDTMKAARLQGGGATGSPVLERIKLLLRGAQVKVLELVGPIVPIFDASVLSGPVQ